MNLLAKEDAYECSLSATACLIENALNPIGHSLLGDVEGCIDESSLGEEDGTIVSLSSSATMTGGIRPPPTGIIAAEAISSFFFPHNNIIKMTTNKRRRSNNR